MSILDIFRGHKHYWGVPIKESDGHFIQLCYSCGKQRTILLRFDAQRPDLVDREKEAQIQSALYQTRPGDVHITKVAEQP
ncbi:MAG TPA: hypothetical protein VFC63_18225 [Blastocatellia bacterium]|nr:hypothetical protein [Blastocatellia bacterium]